jgi:hypothetical protein
MLRRLLLFTLLLLLGTHLVRSQEIQNPTSGELYTPMTFSVPVDSTRYRNPFDNRDIELIGIFQSPTGERIVIPGFWMQPYECVADCQELEVELVDAEPIWQVRFTPQQAGVWAYTLQVRDNAAVVAAQDGNFTVAPSTARGFIGLGQNGRYFEYANGEPYFPIGHNLNWSWSEIGGLETYDRWLHELSAAGGNYARLIMDVPWFINLEWFGQVGDYSPAQQRAAELDTILDRAAAYGVNLQLVLLWHQALQTYNGPPVVLPEGVDRPNVSADWDDNPYNIFNGGPLSGPTVFFFDDQAEDFFRRRLRYIVARWGYSPQVFAWEIIDQADRTANDDLSVVHSWLQRTASYLRQIDQHGHLITVSSRENTSIVAENALLDFGGAQFYQRRPIETIGDQVVGVLDVIQHHLALNPVLLTAYSLNPWFEPTVDDPDGVHFQNTLWATALSGASGGAASDWWDTYIIPQNLSRYYAPLAAFAAGIDWPNLNLQPAQAGLLNDTVETYLPVRISDFRRQFASSPQNVVTHTITADGVLPAITTTSSFLYGQLFNTQFSQVQRYQVAPPVDTYLEIGIEAVSTQADARLIVLVDDARVAEVNLRAGNRDIEVRVPLSAGEHSVVLDNLGDDWLELAYIEVGQLVAPARVLTLRDGEAGVALSWLQHRDYTWEKVAADVERQPVEFRYRLEGMSPGRYVVETWEPLSGAVLGEELVRVGEDGELGFQLLPFDRQLAVRALKQQEPGEVEITPTPVALPIAVPFIAQTNTPAP